MDDYLNCRLCPRKCGVDRTAGQLGRCGETDTCKVASWGPHHGEEPCFSGSRGSGTIFFSGCSCGCFFCQNYQISLEHSGSRLSVRALTAAALTLARERRTHNINLVTPDHFWPHVEQMIRAVRQAGENIPIVFNSSGYQLPEMVDRYSESVDIFMPDFKFAEPEPARLCMGDARYQEIALDALRRMVSAKGFLHPWDSTGVNTALEGVLVRHLILPGYVRNSLAALDLLYREFGRSLPLSVMSQFRPTPECRSRKMLDRTLHADEHRRVVDRVRDLGFQHVFVQELADNSDFMPDFKREQVFDGNSK